MLAIITICQVHCPGFQTYKSEADLNRSVKNLRLDIICQVWHSSSVSVGLMVHINHSVQNCDTFSMLY